MHKIILKKTLKNLARSNKIIAGYGASARSSTLLNYCKINNCHFKFIFDKSIIKNNLYTAGSNILIKKPANHMFRKVQVIFILAWNFKDEIVFFLKKMKFKGTIVTVLPRVKIEKC
jgi:hypothetical protein